MLAGLVLGLLARSAPIEEAAAWAVATHAGCAASLERQVGTVGYLAREVVDAIPQALATIWNEGRC